MKPESKKFLNYIKDKRKFLIYDTETTGLNKVSDVIVEYSAMVMEVVNGKYTCTEFFEQYIRPTFTMSPEVIAIHGITNEFLEDKPYEEEAYKIIKQFLERHKDAVITGYNQYNYDDAMFYNLALRQGDILPEHPAECFDIFTVVKENIFEKSRKLGAMHALLCPEITDIQFHNSSDDIKATWNVAVALAKRLIDEEKASKAEKPIIPVKSRIWSPGAGKSYVFITIKTESGFAEIYYDVYYKCWKSKELNINEYDTTSFEEMLIKTYGSIKSCPKMF